MSSSEIAKADGSTGAASGASRTRRRSQRGSSGPPSRNGLWPAAAFSSAVGSSTSGPHDARRPRTPANHPVLIFGSLGAHGRSGGPRDRRSQQYFGNSFLEFRLADPLFIWR